MSPSTIECLRGLDYMTLRVAIVQANDSLRRRIVHAVQMPHGLDGIRLVRALVRAVAYDAREAQRQATRIGGARLEAVERDLHDELGPDVHHVSGASGLELEQLGRLPLEHFVRHPLEGLPQHHEPAGVRIAGAEVEVREPAAAAAMAPFGGEYDQVECVGA